MKTHQVDVCIVGGGPSGMLMGLLLAKLGIQVLVLESHSNFDREYRGEVLQPLFVQMMEQLNLLSYLEQFPHLRLRGIDFYHKNARIGGATFADAIPEIPYAIWMPQPTLLQALHEKAQEFPSFAMWFDAPVKRLLQEGDQIQGVIVDHTGQEVQVQARVTVGADGRFSTVRRLGRFEMEYEHYENDIAWFTTQKPATWNTTVRSILNGKRNFMVLPKYPDRIQGGISMKKGEWKTFQERGLHALRQELTEASEGLASFAESLVDFKPFHLLQMKTMFVKDWAKNGCLLVGDSAHCSSPAGAIGVSMAVTSAIVAVDVIAGALRENDVSAQRLRRVQEIRAEEIRRIHAVQIRAERFVFSSSQWVQRFRPYVMRLVMKTPLFGRFARGLLLRSENLPISSDLRLTDEEARYNLKV